MRKSDLDFCKRKSSSIYSSEKTNASWFEIISLYFLKIFPQFPIGKKFLGIQDPNFFILCNVSLIVIAYIYKHHGSRGNRAIWVNPIPGWYFMYVGRSRGQIKGKINFLYNLLKYITIMRTLR